MQVPSVSEGSYHQVLTMHIGRYLAALSLLGLALILIYGYASAKVRNQRKLDYANPVTRSPNTDSQPSSEHGYTVMYNRSDMKLDYANPTTREL